MKSFAQALALLVAFSSYFFPVEAGKDDKRALVSQEDDAEPPRKKSCLKVKSPVLPDPQSAPGETQQTGQATTSSSSFEEESEDETSPKGTLFSVEDFLRNSKTCRLKPCWNEELALQEASTQQTASGSGVVADSSPEKAPGPFRLSFPRVEAFETELASAVAEHRFMGLQRNVFAQIPQTNYTIGVFEVAQAFELMEVEKSQWEAASHRLNPLRWPFQTTQSAVGAHVFFHAALDTPHRNLLINTLRPFLAFARGEVALEEVYEKTSETLAVTVGNHPCLSRRVAVYNFAESARQGNPLARFVLLHCLWRLAASHQMYHRAQEGKSEYDACLLQDVSLPESTRRFFTRQNILIRTSLLQSQEPLKQFLDVPGIEAFVDLPKNLLNNQDLIAEKEALGLDGYKQWWIYNHGKNKHLWAYTREEFHKIFKMYQDAAIQGDWKATRTLAISSYQVPEEYFSPEEQKSLKLYLRHLQDFAIWQGYPDSSQRFPYRSFDGLQVPVTEEAAFAHLKDFLRAPPLKPRVTSQKEIL